MIDITKIIIKTMEKSDLDLIKDTISTDFDEFWSYDNILNEIRNISNSLKENKIEIIKFKEKSTL